MLNASNLKAEELKQHKRLSDTLISYELRKLQFTWTHQKWTTKLEKCCLVWRVSISSAEF